MHSRASREIRLSVYSTVVFKSDQELVILALLDAAKPQRGEAIRFRKEETTAGEQPTAEEPPVGEHQSNGEVERTIQYVQGQMMTLRLALHSVYLYRRNIRIDHV